jgi:hypothetical protein
MPDYRMTNEQKLEEIYEIITADESRRKSLMWLGVFKWIIIIAAVTYVAMNPKMVMQQVTERIQPFVLATASGMIENQKADLKKSIEEILGGVPIQQ